MSRCVITKEVNHNVPHGRLRGYQPEIEDHFYDFDYVLVSFSGGKDSGILLPLCMDYIGRKLQRLLYGQVLFSAS